MMPAPAEKGKISPEKTFISIKRLNFVTVNI